MKKVIKIGFPILCVAVIGGTFILLNKTVDRINRNKLSENNVKQNTIRNSIVRVVEENKVEMGNTISTTLEEEKNKEIKNKAKAIELVKKFAPPTTNSYYTNEGMDGDNYLVAIRDNDTKNSTIYYSVDIENEKIEIYVK